MRAAPFREFIKLDNLNCSFLQFGQFGAFQAFVRGQTWVYEPPQMAEILIRKANLTELDDAFRIVEEYYDAVGVIARDTKEEFSERYFGELRGVWLASVDGDVIGCIALRELPEQPRRGEIKRMYVRPAHRRGGIAQALLNATESFAAAVSCDWLYLDSAPGMDAAVRFYRRNGYEPCPRYNDNPQATVFLRKRIT